MAEPKVVGATAALQRAMAATQARIALGNMLEFRAALLREMPGKMDSMCDRIGEWCQLIAPAIKELEWAAPSETEEP